MGKSQTGLRLPSCNESAIDRDKRNTTRAAGETKKQHNVDEINTPPLPKARRIRPYACAYLHHASRLASTAAARSGASPPSSALSLCWSARLERIGYFGKPFPALSLLSTRGRHAQTSLRLIANWQTTFFPSLPVHLGVLVTPHTMPPSSVDGLRLQPKAMRCSMRRDAGKERARRSRTGVNRKDESDTRECAAQSNRHPENRLPD